MVSEGSPGARGGGGGGGGGGRLCIPRCGRPAAARRAGFRFPPLPRLAADDTERLSPPPPRGTAVGGRGPDRRGARGGGRRRGRALGLTRAHPPRPHAGLAHSRPRAATPSSACCSAARRGPFAPAARRLTRPGLPRSPPSAGRPGSPPPTSARTGSQRRCGQGRLPGLPAFPPHTRTHTTLMNSTPLPKGIVSHMENPNLSGWQEEKGERKKL